ncbi:hypothetical protein ACJJTC_009929 [Scirpophaga incertulas]
MELRYVVFSIVFIVGIMQNVTAMPRDSTVVIENSLPANESVDIEKKFVQVEHEPAVNSEHIIPGRVWCQHEGAEAAEDEVCQGHCIPKGYSYGLCVSNTCSCI